MHGKCMQNCGAGFLIGRRLLEDDGVDRRIQAFPAAFKVAFMCPDLSGVNLPMSEKKHNLQYVNK
jgi:hypothetical protein